MREESGRHCNLSKDVAGEANCMSAFWEFLEYVKCFWDELTFYEPNMASPYDGNDTEMMRLGEIPSERMAGDTILLTNDLSLGRIIMPEEYLPKHPQVTINI